MTSAIRTNTSIAGQKTVIAIVARSRKNELYANKCSYEVKLFNGFPTVTVFMRADTIPSLQ